MTHGHGKSAMSVGHPGQWSIAQQGEGNPHPHFDSFFNGRKTEHSVFLESRTFWAMSVSDELRLWHPFPTFMRVRPLTHPFGLRDFALRQSSNQASKLTLPPSIILPAHKSRSQDAYTIFFSTVPLQDFCTRLVSWTCVRTCARLCPDRRGYPRLL